MKVSDVLKSGEPVRIDLLTAEPISTDPATWAFPADPAYRPCYAFPLLNWDIDGLAGKLNVYFPKITPLPGFFGVTFNGNSLMVGAMETSIAPDQEIFFGQITFIIQRWEAV